MSAVVPSLRDDWGISATASVWLTASVQLGFVAGALASALLNLADRVRPHRLGAPDTPPRPPSAASRSPGSPPRPGTKTCPCSSTAISGPSRRWRRPPAATSASDHDRLGALSGPQSSGSSGPRISATSSIPYLVWSSASTSRGVRGGVVIRAAIAVSARTPASGWAETVFAANSAG